MAMRKYVKIVGFSIVYNVATIREIRCVFIEIFLLVKSTSASIIIL